MPTRVLAKLAQMQEKKIPYGVIVTMGITFRRKAARATPGARDSTRQHFLVRIHVYTNGPPKTTRHTIRFPGSQKSLLQHTRLTRRVACPGKLFRCHNLCRRFPTVGVTVSASHKIIGEAHVSCQAASGRSMQCYESSFSVRCWPIYPGCYRPRRIFFPRPLPSPFSLCARLRARIALHEAHIRPRRGRRKV